MLEAAKATLRTLFCVLLSDKKCKRYSTFQATKAIQLSRKINLIAAVGAHISIQDTLGLDSLTSLPQVHASYKEILLIVHPDKNNGVVVDGESQTFQNFQEAFKVFKDAHVAEADNPRPINHRPRAAASSAPAAAPGPAAAPRSAPQPQSHGPAHGTSAASDHNIFGHCIIADANNSYHNWDVGLQFRSDKEIAGSFLNSVISLLHPRCLWERIAQNSPVA